MATVEDLLKFKDESRLVTISPKKTVLDAIKLMSDENIGSLIVLDDITRSASSSTTHT